MKNNLIKYFIELVKIDSESKNEKLIAEKLEKDLLELGAKITYDKANLKTGGNSGNLYGYFPGNIQIDSILFCSHLDTVKPGNNIKPQILGDRITSDGTTILGSDDKSGVAQIIWAIKEMKAQNENLPPIEVLFTISEEIGLLGAKYLDYSLIKSKFGFALDTHGIGQVTIGAPSQNSIEYVIHGKEAHAGAEPEKGINAIKIAAEAISKMPIGRIDFETTSNVGIIEGGKATNIVPNEVVIKAEARSHDSEKLQKVTDEMTGAVKNAVNKIENNQASVDINIKREYDSFEIDKDDDIVKLSKVASENCNLNFKADISGGGSDANIFNANGLKMIIAGTGMENVHTVDEYIMLEDLENGVKWIKEVIREYAKG